MFTTTDAQNAALARESQRTVCGVKIDLATDLLYCTGAESVTLSGDTFTPRGMSVTMTDIAEPRRARATIEIDDQDGTIATAWYSERFSGQTVTIREAIHGDGAWVEVRSIPWVCHSCERKSDGTFVLHLLGAGGFAPRAGLQVAARDDWHLAPEPGTSIRVGPGAITVG